MKVNLLLLVCLFAVTISGCVSSSGPMPFGKDSYMISTSARGGLDNPGSATQGAIKEANAHCASMGKVLMPRNTTQTGTPGWPGGAQLIYSCISENDPEYQRPNWEKSPDTVIRVK
jgi:hypothetical protein